jgi:ATP-dependent Clp protease, protease subunit
MHLIDLNATMEDGMNKKEIEFEQGPDLRVRLNPKALSWDLFLFGEVEPRRVAELIQHMLVLDATDEKRPINLLLCSPGGHCSAGYALIDVITSMRHVVRTIALGEVCSMGSLIFISGTPGQRYMGSRTLCLFHPISDSVADYGSFIKDRVKSLEQSERLSEELLKSRTGLTSAMIDKANHGELWLDAGECLKYKVADTIITDNEVIAQMYGAMVKERAKVAPKRNKKK